MWAHSPNVGLKCGDRRLFHGLGGGLGVPCIANRHHGDDFLAVEVERQRALDDNRGGDRDAILVGALDPLGQAWIFWIGRDQKFVVAHFRFPQEIREPAPRPGD